MSNARDLINAHLYQVLATFSVILLAIQIAPIANQARYSDHCVDQVIKEAKGSFAEKRAFSANLCSGS
ncbi:MAG: hypothetical protein CL860_04675 [Cyanobium sp. MED195]|nr:hypothetical protein [Cyanobium sp. MED195]